MASIPSGIEFCFTKVAPHVYHWKSIPSNEFVNSVHAVVDVHSALPSSKGLAQVPGAAAFDVDRGLGS